MNLKGPDVLHQMVVLKMLYLMRKLVWYEPLMGQTWNQNHIDYYLYLAVSCFRFDATVFLCWWIVLPRWNIKCNWAVTWDDFQQCGTCDQQSLRSVCAYAQSDQSLCLSLEYSMIVRLLIEHHLEFLSLKGGCRGSSESALVKMSNCWKSQAAAQIWNCILQPSWCDEDSGRS